jgi:hypothetical protein
MGTFCFILSSLLELAEGKLFQTTGAKSSFERIKIVHTICTLCKEEKLYVVRRISPIVLVPENEVLDMAM